MDKFEALIGDVVLATLVAVVEAETDYGMLDMNCRKIADTKQKMLSAYTAIEAENKELKAWVREAVSIKCSCCDFCETHKCNPTTCFYRRGEKLLLEGADKEEAI